MRHLDLFSGIGGFKLSKAGHRVQRLKALGNSIVPQVAIEIMRAIKATEDALSPSKGECTMGIEQSLDSIAKSLEYVAGGLAAKVAKASKEEKVRVSKAAEVKVEGTTVTEDDMFGAESPVEQKITSDMVLASLQKFRTKHGLDKAKQLMIKHGADAAKPVISSIPEANYAELLKEIGA